MSGDEGTQVCTACGTTWTAPVLACPECRGETVTVRVMDPDTARELSRAAKNVTTWTEKRNALIREALAAGAGVREVARATDLAPATVLNIQSPKKRGGTS